MLVVGCWLLLFVVLCAVCYFRGFGLCLLACLLFNVHVLMLCVVCCALVVICCVLFVACVCC